jgi:TM2 domain-containing membrane protein YozV
MNLAPLPIATRQIFLANVTAIVLIAVAFAVDVNAVSSLFFPMVVTMEEPSFAAYVYFARAHFAGVLLASLFVSFAMFALIGTLMVLLPDSVFRRISIYVRVLVVILLLALLCSTFAVAPLLSTLHAGASSFLRWLPPVWFLGLARMILGKADAAMAQMGIIGLWAVIAVSILAPLVYVLSYYRYFIRIPETLDTTLQRRAPRILFPMRLMDLFVLRSAYDRATYRFAMKTLLRNDRHSLIFGGFAGLGIVIASQTLLSAVNQKPSATPSAALISVPFTLAYFLICGLRFVFDLPAELRANWVHRVILYPEQQAPADAARKVVLTFVLPWILAVCLPLYVYDWGWPVGTALTAVLISGCYLLADVLLRRFAKIPFACAYPAWKQSATVIVLFYVLGLWVFASLLPRLEHALLLKSAWYLWGLVLVLQVVRLALRRLRDDDPRSKMLVFEDAPDTPFELLNLSGH